MNNCKQLQSKSASRRKFLGLPAICLAGLLISCQNGNQNGGQMNSNTNANTATSANQNSADQPTTGKGNYAEVNGLKMYYEIHGAGRSLVLLHGSFFSATFYPALAEGRKVIAVDLQGHGRTADIDRPFTFEQMADDVAELLKQLKIEQTDVFGYSMGGTVGLALAIRHPELVRRLAIFGAVYRPMEESWTPEMVKDWNKITPENFNQKELKEPYEKLSPAPNWKGLVTKILQMEKDFKGFSPEKMKAIKAEVFISAGDREDIPAEHLAKMRDLIPNSQLAIFPNTKHILLFDPNKMPLQIKEFLNADEENNEQ